MIKRGGLGGNRRGGSNARSFATVVGATTQLLVDVASERSEGEQPSDRAIERNITTEERERVSSSEDPAA